MTWEEEQVRALQLQRLQREKARRWYREYLPYVHRGAWKKTRMGDYLADRVQEFVETDTGHAYDVLLIMTPPQHGKSMTVTESFISWYIGKYPWKRCILTAYNDSFAEKFGRRNQEKIEEYGKALFGIGKSPNKKWTKSEYELAGAPGAVIAKGIMSGITGNPADLLIIDDPIKNREEADSETYRKKLWEAWTEVLKTRLQAGAKVICIMTPWHEDDLIGRMRQYEENVTVIRLPVEAEEDDPLGREVGDALCPELGKGKAWLEEFKRVQLNDPTQGGLRAWTALYMCSPRTEGGNIIKREWWRYYDPALVKEFGAAYISVDAAFKDGEKNDFVAIQVWSKRGFDFYLRHSINKHLNFQATIAEILRIKQTFPEVSRILIEDKANGSAIIQTLQQRMIGVIGINPQGGKEARVNAVSAAIETGHVYLPRPSANAPNANQDFSWVEEFVQQCTIFPAGKHDDLVDAMSQCLNYMLYVNGAYLPPGEEEMRALERETQARRYMVDNNAMFGDIYGGYGGHGGNGGGDPYDGIYGSSGAGFDGGIW